MIQKYVIPFVALAGVALAVMTVVWNNQAPPPKLSVSEVPQPPYSTLVAGSGLVEAGTGNISIGTHVAGIISKIYVQINEEVKAGDPLFAIDDRATRADIDTRRADVQVAKAQLAEAEYELGLAQKLESQKVDSAEELNLKRFVKQKAEAQLILAQSELKAGTIELERLTVCAPVDGQVLQINCHPGEFADAAPVAGGEEPLILFGGVEPLHVRVDVDENDAWRVRDGTSAIGRLRGNNEISVPLTFVRFEPYVVPKKSLTGDSAERVDTRVLQVIFSFSRGDLPIFVGQQMDVFIDAQAIK